MILSFRLYGHFHWPPTPAEPPANPAIVSGVVEVRSALKEGRQHPWLRWVPGRHSDPPRPTDSDLPSKSIFSYSPTEAADALAKGEGLWLSSDGQAKLADQTWLIFRGAFLFEQHQPNGDEDKPEVQWPLVTRCEYYKGKPVYSVLGVCHKTKPLLYLNFHLPYPVRRTSLRGTNELNPPVFPFSAVFDLAPGSHEDFLTIDTLVGGWKEGDQLPDLDNEEVTCFPFEGAKQPETMRLGAFGFAEHGERTGTEFAIYGLRSYKSRRYWPLNRRSLLQGILWRYGFSIDYNDTDWLKATDLGIADSSLRFVRPHGGESGDRGQRSALIYRASVERRGLGKSGDLQTDWSGLRIRLGQEIGGRLAQGTQFGASDVEITAERNAEIEGWLRIGEELSADCELSWEIARQDIWTENRSVDWSPSVTIRLHWLETIRPGDVRAAPAKAQPQGGRHDHDFKAGFLAQAHHTFQVVRESLDPGEAGRPHSFLPDLSAKKSNVRFALYGSPLPAEICSNGAVLWGRPEPTREVPLPPWRRPPMRLSLARPEHPEHLIADAGEEAPELQLSGANLTFFQQKGVKLALTLSHDESWPPQSADSIEDGHPFFASFKMDTLPTTDWEGRLSSLQFIGVKKAPSTRQSGHLRIGGRGMRLGLGQGAPVLTYPDGRIAAEIRLPLSAARVEPIGVDVARSDRSGRPGPLLIPLDAKTGDAAASDDVFWLVATETLSPTHDRHLEATLSENSQETGTRSYVVLSSEPFSVFRFTHQPLHGRGQADTAAVAFYSGDDRIWQYRRTSAFYHYVFPPQAIGESADKPRRLEIHDLPNPDPKNEMPPRPFVLIPRKDEHGKDVKDDDGNIVLDPESDVRRRAVEFRLTPSAEVWIRPSDVERGYFMPESASYEIFRQSGQYGLGAALGYLRAEFLYGLPVGIDVGKERSISRGARVAELEALTGRLTGPARETNAESRLADRWNALRAAVARRPERLEIWARDLDSPIDFTPARFTDGVRFALRHTALHRPPVLDLRPSTGVVVSESADDYVSPPRIAGLEPDQVPPELEAHPRYHPQGLSGGALWPVESLNLFRTMLQAPQSSGGAIESIALSPTGGDATQKAEFLGGKVTIISDTRNGYVERQQVEVLGRICALWHRAKHVVVYERTVNPSAQFAPKKKDDEERTRSRRPILRKVREYIELLQPERGYPDFSTAAPRSAGFLERVRFNARIINVDSAWAREVGDFGWEIPLWNRSSARERPQVYPMPDICFVSTAEGDAEKPVVAQECLDPDYLFFFADFSGDTTADTDTWPSRLNLDFPNMPVAQEIARRADARSAADPGDDRNNERRRRAVGRILPGLRRFTWRLAPGAQKVAINAGRSDKPVYVGLDSVTFMRATHTSGQHKKLPGNLERLFEAKINSVHPKDEVPDIVGLKYWEKDGTGASPPSAGEFATKLDAVIQAAMPGSNGTEFRNARDDLYQFWTTSALATDIKKLAARVEEDQFGGISEAIKSGPSYCATLKADAVGIIQRKEILVRAALQDWVAHADEFLIPGLIFAGDAQIYTGKQRAIANLTNWSISHIRPLFQEASKDIGKLEEGVEKARGALIDLETEIEAVIGRARQRITQFVSGYDQTKPWSKERRRAFRAGLQACVSNVQEDIGAAIDETRQRLAVELNEVSQAIGGHIAKALKKVVSLEADGLNNITTVYRFVDRLLEKIDKTLEGLLESGPGDKLDHLMAQVQAANIDSDLKDTAEAALQAMKTACDEAKARIADARAQAQGFDASAEEAATQISAAVQALAAALREIGTAISQQAQDLATLSTDLMNEGADEIAGAFTRISAELRAAIEEIAAWPEQWLEQIGNQIDAMLTPAEKVLDAVLERLHDELRKIPATALPIIEDVKQALSAAQAVLAPDALLESVVANQIVRPAITQILAPIPDRIDIGDDETIRKHLEDIRARLALLVEAVEELTRNLTESSLGALDEVTRVCDAVFEGAEQVEAYLKGLAAGAEQFVAQKLTDAFDVLSTKLDQITGTIPDDVAGLIAAVDAFDYSVRSMQNNMSRAYETARMYGDRVFDQFSKLDDGGILAAPSNILKLYSAVTSGPELAALKADIDRIRAGFDELSDIIETTKANALFNRLGDELKALGLSLPFDSIGDRLMPADLSNFQIGNVFRNFGGAKLDNLLKGYKIPPGVKDAVRVTHDFDKKQARAWVQVDINATMTGRRSLFSFGIFKADFVDMQLTGQVRLEASKDQEKVTETGYGRIGTTIDLVTGGQSMVRFEKFGLSFTREQGLDVEFDPKNIRLNPSFKFIQDFLSTLFPDEVGGLEIIKDNGIPVGVQHEFSIPPLALNFGTSGVSNISISNHFKLLAFPDFLLANRFNLSTVERPFIFSIFIIGGTGYIQIDAEYRPFDRELMVSVEAGAGGSASLAFAIGPFVGQVFITLSGTLTYRKAIGRPGGGLSISAVLVIAGHVSVAGIVTVGIVLMLRMTYRDNGQIDADGTLTVTIRISKFFKLTARANAKYKLRSGKSETIVTTSSSAEIEDKELKDKAEKLKDAAKKLEAARN